MVEVQEDLKSLKQQVASAESALHDDSAVSTLESEVGFKVTVRQNLGYDLG
jgi:hypothetical protein